VSPHTASFHREPSGQRFHDLWHFAASLLLNRGVAPSTIMGIPGHSQFALNMNTYAHLSLTLEYDVARVPDAVLVGSKMG
jgi:integrase